MARFTIHVDTASQRFIREVRAGGNILCTLYILVDNWPFPSDSWLDFPVIVLSWWLEGCLEMYKVDEPIENSFMNGPFEFTSLKDGESVRLTFTKRTLAGAIELRPPVRILLDEYRNELVRTTQELLDALDKYSASGQDVDNLRIALDSLRSL